MKNWYSMQAKGAQKAEIQIYDEIGLWGISAKDFAKDLKALGDIKVLDNQYESMKNWIAFMENSAGDDYTWTENWHYGDWLSFDDSKSNYMGAYTTIDLIATAYYSYSSSLVAKAATVLGREEDARYYSELSEKVKRAFNEEFVTPNGRLVAHTQTAYTLALAFDLLEEEQAKKAASLP